MRDCVTANTLFQQGMTRDNAMLCGRHASDPAINRVGLRLVVHRPLNYILFMR
jgi:hypothetical protein